MKVGDAVWILRHKRVLVAKLKNIAGGWEIDRPVHGLTYWNEGSIRVTEKPRNAIK